MPLLALAARRGAGAGPVRTPGRPARRQLLLVRPEPDQPSRREQVLQTEVKKLQEQVLLLSAGQDGKGGGKGPKNKNDKNKEKCFFCDKPGHRAHQCRKLKGEYEQMKPEAQEKWKKYMQVKVDTVKTQALQAQGLASASLKISDIL